MEWNPVHLDNPCNLVPNLFGNLGSDEILVKYREVSLLF
jgi:hypothetical protein